MTNSGRYDSYSFMLPIEYNPIFYRVHKPNIWNTVKKFSRKEIIRLSMLLKNEYVNQPFDKLLYLLSDGNWWKRYTYFNLYEYVYRHQRQDVSYCACFNQTIIELLRYSFSIPSSHNSIEEYNKYSFEFDIVKTIALINENNVRYHTKVKPNLSELLLVGLGSNKEIQQFDFQSEFIYQANLCANFFQYLTSQEKYKDLYLSFLKHYNILDWREYEITLLSLAIMSRNKAGKLILDAEHDPDHLINQGVVSQISVNYDSEVIPYESKNIFDKNGNSDYRVFRDKPLIRINSKEYIMYFEGFVLNRLYSSLYFDFQRLTENLKKKSVYNIFTEEFVEKTVLCSLLNNICDGNVLSLSEEQCKQQFKIKQSDLGYPDYIIQNRNKNSIIIFECKDIRFNSWVKEQNNSELLKAELRNKLQLKEWKLDFENQKRIKLKAPRRIGTGQLAGHCANIRNSYFKWGDNVSNNSKVYPVLVIADDRLIVNGLPKILQNMYEEQLQYEGVKLSSLNRPLIILSPLCLLKYQDRFKRDGFIRYFEDYFKSIEGQMNKTLDAINSQITFEEYMSQYPYHLDDVFDNLKNDVLSYHKHNYPLGKEQLLRD